MVIICFSSTCNNPDGEFGWETAWLLLLSPFGWFSHLFPTFTHHPAALIPLSADLTWRRSNLFVFNGHSIVYSIILGLYDSCPGPFSTGNPIFTCKTPHWLTEGEFGASSYLPHTHFLQGQQQVYSPLTIFLWMWEVNVTYLNFRDFPCSNKLCQI